MYFPKLAGYLFLLWLRSADLESSTNAFRTGNDENFGGFIDVFRANKSNEKNSSEKVFISGNEIPMPAGFSIFVSKNEDFHFQNKSAKNKVGRDSKMKSTVGKNAHKIVRNVAKRLSALMNDNNNNNNNYNISTRNNDDKNKNGIGKRSAGNTYTTFDEKKRRKFGRKLLESEPSTTDFTKKAEEKTTMKTTEANEKNHQVTTQPDDYDDDSKENKQTNSSELGSYLGGPCETTCSENLIHVFCDHTKRICECEEKYPVQIGARRGCEKPKQLGDQCFYEETCSFFDSNAECTQINHNAICQCKPGFHTVALRKGVKRMFCSEDIAVVSADLPTLLGVATGIAVLTGLLCFVLKLFSGNRYPATRHYGNANLAPPLLFSSDNQWINGIPLTVQGRSSSRSSCQRSTTSLAQYPRSKGVLVPASRAGAARAAAILLIPCHLQPSRHSDSEVDNEEVDGRENAVESFSRTGSRRHSLTSVHSTTSSQKSMSYSARRFEQENQQREQRAAMRAAREEAARLAALPTPSPCSTEDVLLINTSTNNEEDFLCTSPGDTPAQSEPPALLFQKNNAEASTK